MAKEKLPKARVCDRCSLRKAYDEQQKAAAKKAAKKDKK